jgi:hypothetical protein
MSEACSFHAAVRWAQCGEILTREDIAKDLGAFYGVAPPEHKPDDAELIGVLSGDMLAYVFSFLSMKERNVVRLVSKTWNKRSFMYGDDPRMWTCKDSSEMPSFFRANSSVHRIGHLRSTRSVLSLFDREDFPSHRISELHLVDATVPAVAREHRPSYGDEQGVDLNTALAHMMHKLPALQSLTLKLSQEYPKLLQIAPSVRELRIISLSTQGQWLDATPRHSTLCVLYLDLGVGRNLNQLIGIDLFFCICLFLVLCVYLALKKNRFRIFRG